MDWLANLCRWHYCYCWRCDGGFIKKNNVNDFFDKKR